MTLEAQMVAHTPGPWLARGEGVFDRESKEWICGCNLEMNGEANACLIAAAPDLLAALQEVMRWESSGFAPQSKAKAAEMAYAAIAKATGGNKKGAP